ncbi:hypothetical protein M885DRAFT_626914 [Pelagophyceae sp. CCMP2097]|nr:hypothetical protein M885DRAFT_626914 [Pelagophyceae sp. CCMP2097]
MLPLIPLLLGGGGATFTAVGSWALMKYERLNLQMQQVVEQTQQLQSSTDAARDGSIWGELLEPVAKRWAGALKIIAYSLCATSAAVIVIGTLAWLELRHLRAESTKVRKLQQEIDRLRADLDGARLVGARPKLQGRAPKSQSTPAIANKRAV